MVTQKLTYKMFFNLYEHNVTFFSACDRPTSGCQDNGDVYANVDCDGDGILDHACSTTYDDKRYLVLSTEACPNDWGTNSRTISECPAAWVNSEDSIDLPCPDDCTDPSQGTCNTSTGFCECEDEFLGDSCAGNEHSFISY